jgi:hypothetical protein
LAYNIEHTYHVTDAGATSVTLSWTRGDGARFVAQPPQQIVLVWASAAEKPIGMNVGSRVTVRVHA